MTKKAETAQPTILVEDGILFLSRKGLDEYRGQKMMLAWNEGAYS